jgi:hypothetical protein
MSKHTPGPWKAVDSKDERGNTNAYAVWPEVDRPFANSPRGNRICVTPDGTTPENKANAALIAAAPELLASLKKCVPELKAWMKDHGEDIATLGALNDALIAIAKAERE